MLKLDQKIKIGTEMFEVKMLNSDGYYLYHEDDDNSLAFTQFGISKEKLLQEAPSNVALAHGNFPFYESLGTLAVAVNYLLSLDNISIITTDQAASIIDMACQDWKLKLAKKWGADMVLNSPIKVTEDFRQSMFEAATSVQMTTLKEIFPPKEPDLGLVKGQLIYAWDYDERNKRLCLFHSPNTHRDYKVNVYNFSGEEEIVTYFKHFKPLTREEINQFLKMAPE